MPRSPSLNVAEVCSILSELDDEDFKLRQVPSFIGFATLQKGGYIEVSSGDNNWNRRFRLTDKGIRTAIEFEKAMERHYERLQQ